MNRLIRPAVLAMEGYTPGEQVNDCIKLNTNECALPPGPAVSAALHDYAAGKMRVYPSPRADALRAAAAELYGVRPDMVVAGNGSDDLLTILVRTLVDPGEAIAVPSPTYGLYDTLAAIQGARVEHVPYGPNWELPRELGDIEAKIVFVSSPNNPSATRATRAELLDLADRTRGMLVVDEAYADFTGETLIDEVEKRPNLVVLRTFSKSYALAGARLGLLFAQASLVKHLMNVKDSYNVNGITQTLGLAALGDQAYLRHVVDTTVNERKWLEGELAARGFRWPASAANFLLVEMGSAERAQSTYAALKARGILVRYWSKPRLATCLRITVGTREQHVRLLAGMDSVT